jgi:hypothetical protein
MMDHTLSREQVSVRIFIADDIRMSRIVHPEKD